MTAPKLPEGLEPRPNNAVLVPATELRKLQEDAARYRWLRMNRLWLKANLPGIAAPLFDEAIDSALLAAKEAK